MDRPQPPLRVALLHNIISPHVLPLFERLGKEPGIKLKVYFLAESDQNRRWATDIGQSFDYTILPNYAIRFGRKDLYTYFVNPTVIPTLVHDGFDVLVAAGWDSFASQVMFFCSRILRKPYVQWSGSTANEPSWRRTVTLPLVKMMARGAAGCIAYGTRARQYLEDLGANPQRIAVAYNTVDVDWYQSQADALRPNRAQIRADLGLLPDGQTVLYVGQLIERKGILDLLASHKVLTKERPRVELLVVGYGPLETAVRELVERERILNVHFAGHVAIADLPRYYVASDCFVLPSHEEVWGLVLNEAAACGLPLVTTSAVGGSADLVRPGVNGFVVSAGAPQELAIAISEALDRSSEFGPESRRMIDGFTYAQNVAAIANLLRQIGGASPRAHVTS